MIIASCRKYFWSDAKFSDPRPKCALREGDAILGDADLLERAAGKRVLVLVHGYYTSRAKLERAYAAISEKVFQFDLGYDLVVGFAWPGGVSPLTYLWAKKRTEEAGEYLRNLLGVLWAGGAAAIDINAHSLGNRVALYALLRDRGVRNLLMLSAAVDNECLETGEKFNRSALNCERVVVFYSKRDPILTKFYAISDFDSALGRTGPQNPLRLPANVVAVNGEAYMTTHGGYRDSAALYEDWKKRL